MSVSSRALAVWRDDRAAVDLLAARSRAALDRSLDHGAELGISIPASDAIALGAFQRGHHFAREHTLVRRGSGGPSVRIGPGSVHVALALAHPAALVPCDAARIVNRYVRPLLRALTRCGAQAHYFGRDWISVKHRPAAEIVFAHDAQSRRTLVEAFIAVRTPFALGSRPSFLEKEPGTVEEIAGRAIDTERLIEEIVGAYAAASGREVIQIAAPETNVIDEDTRADPPWSATHEEAIGEVAAGRDRTGALRVGGDLLVSRDALAALEACLSALASDADERALAGCIDQTLHAPGVALDGVRSLVSVLDVIRRAR